MKDGVDLDIRIRADKDEGIITLTLVFNLFLPQFNGNS